VWKGKIISSAFALFQSNDLRGDKTNDFHGYKPVVWGLNFLKYFSSTNFLKGNQPKYFHVFWSFVELVMDFWSWNAMVTKGVHLQKCTLFVYCWCNEVEKCTNSVHIRRWSALWTSYLSLQPCFWSFPTSIVWHHLLLNHLVTCTPNIALQQTNSFTW